MVEKHTQRKLAAILAADVVGYSRLMETDEAGTLARLKILQDQLLNPATAQFGGRVFKTTGDGALAEFPSIVDAVQCAIAIQRGASAENTEQSAQPPLKLRIGISLGDVIIEGQDLYGNGVNIAARLETMADPGGICIAGNVYEQVRSLPESTSRISAISRSRTSGTLSRRTRSLSMGSRSRKHPGYLR